MSTLAPNWSMVPLLAGFNSFLKYLIHYYSFSFFSLCLCFCFVYFVIIFDVFNIRECLEKYKQKLLKDTTKVIDSLSQCFHELQRPECLKEAVINLINVQFANIEVSLSQLERCLSHSIAESIKYEIINYYVINEFLMKKIWECSMKWHIKRKEKEHVQGW